MHLRAVAMVVSAACSLHPAIGQSQPTPGLPSIPFTPAAQAQNGGAGPAVTYQYGMEFVTIGGQGNAPYLNPDWQGFPVYGSGSVNYEYRMGRYEVTTAQWAAFFDAVAVVRNSGQTVPFVTMPSFANFAVQGGRLVAQAGHEMDPVGGITWRTAAMYANWLNNNQAVTRAAFMNGAYDVSTFGYVNGNRFTDQPTHNPGARFWIPTIDEVIHAQHYDPNRYGPGQGGYWNYNISQDTQPAYGPAGSVVNGVLAQANSDWVGPGNDPYAPFATPLGSYPLAQSPWGLLDAAGGTMEWTEGIADFGGARQRYVHGSGAADEALIRDALANFPSDFPSFPTYNFGLRIAAAVPAPGSGGVALLTCFWYTRRPQRREYPNAQGFSGITRSTAHFYVHARHRG